MKNSTLDKSDYFFLGVQVGGSESVINSESDKSNLYLKDEIPEQEEGASNES